MLNTPLTELRRRAPGSLKVKDLVPIFAKKKYPRSEEAIGAFERGYVQAPEPRFIDIYAQAISAAKAEVERAHGQTLRWRRRQRKAEKAA